MSQFVESLENRSLMSASVSMSPMATPEAATKLTAKVAATIPNLVGVYRGSYVANSYFKITFTSEAKGKLKGKIFGLGFAAAPNAATLTIPLTGTVDAKHKFTAQAKGIVKSVVGTVNFTYDFAGTTSPDGKKINGKLTITSIYKGHGGSVKFNFNATKNP
jgi:hypothetical protein